MSPDAAVDDGLIHCFVIRSMNVFNTLTLGTSLLFGNLKNHKDVDYFTAKEVHVRSTDAIRTNVDGEEGPSLPIRIRVLPQYIEVIVPEEV